MLSMRLHYQLETRCFRNTLIQGLPHVSNWKCWTWAISQRCYCLRIYYQKQIFNHFVCFLHKKRKMASFSLLRTTENSMTSLLKTDILCYWPLISLENSMVSEFLSSLTSIETIIMSRLKKVINEKLPLLLIMNSLNLMSCILDFATAQLHFKLWWITFLLISLLKVKLQSTLITSLSDPLTLPSITRLSMKYLNVLLSTISISTQRNVNSHT